MTDSVFKANLAHLGGAPVLGRLTAGLRRIAVAPAAQACGQPAEDLGATEMD